MIVSAIAAVARYGVIGKDNQIPWYLPADLAWFKRTTLHRHVIMGRKSFESIGRPLPKRVNVVVTRNPFYIADGILVLPSVEDALAMARDHGETEAFIIGGGEIYRQSMVYWDRIYLTEVDIEPEGDAFFPEIDPDTWREVSVERHAPDEKNACAYAFRILEKIPR